MVIIKNHHHLWLQQCSHCVLSGLPRRNPVVRIASKTVRLTYWAMCLSESFWGLGIFVYGFRNGMMASQVFKLTNDSTVATTKAAEQKPANP